MVHRSVLLQCFKTTSREEGGSVSSILLHQIKGDRLPLSQEMFSRSVLCDAVSVVRLRRVGANFKKWTLRFCASPPASSRVGACAFATMQMISFATEARSKLSTALRNASWRAQQRKIAARVQRRQNRPWRNNNQQSSSN